MKQNVLFYLINNFFLALSIISNQRTYFCSSVSKYFKFVLLIFFFVVKSKIAPCAFLNFNFVTRFNSSSFAIYENQIQNNFIVFIFESIGTYHQLNCLLQTIVCHRNDLDRFDYHLNIHVE